MAFKYLLSTSILTSTLDMATRYIFRSSILTSPWDIAIRDLRRRSICTSPWGIVIGYLLSLSNILTIPWEMVIRFTHLSQAMVVLTLFSTSNSAMDSKLLSQVTSRAIALKWANHTTVRN